MPMGRKPCPDCGALLFGNERFCPWCGACHKGASVLVTAKHIKVLERFLPERSLERLLASETGIVSERRYAAVMFADVSGFTAMSEELPAEQVAETMNSVFEGLVAAVHRYDGTVDKYIGDAVMAIFGAPVAHDNDPERAVCAALEMMASIRDWSEKSGRRLQLAIGINAGPLVAGTMGGHGRLNYSVLGDTVNTAQRLEAAAGAGRILVTREVYQRAKDVVRFKTLAPIKVKGKRNPVDVWEARERRQRSDAAGLAHNFVGQRAALDQLRALLQTPGGQAVALIGEAGVGRSAAVEQLLKAAQTAQIDPIVVSCPPYAAQADAGLLTEAVARLLKVRISQGQGAIKDGKARLVELGLTEQEAALLLAGASREKLDTATPDYEATLKATAAAFMRVLGSCAARQRTLVVLEDLQWAASSVRAQVQALLALNVPRGATLILSARREAASLFDVRKDLTRLELSPLSAEETLAVVADRLGLAMLDEKVAARIHELTHGNPRMIEELLQSLIEQGVIFRSRNRWIVSPRLAQVNLPPSLEALISARIDELDPDSRRFLQSAAVVGTRFDPEAVRRVAQLQLDLEWVLSVLLDRRMVAADEQHHSHLRFVHETYRRVAADTMATRDRRLLHVRMGQYLQETADLKDPRVLQAAAFHLGEGGDPERGAAVMLRAAKRLLQLHQIDSGRELLEKLVGIGAPHGYANHDLSRCENELDEALYHLGMLMLRKGELEAAEDKLQWAYGRARHFFNGDFRVWSLLGLARLNLARGRADEARKHLELAAVDSEGMRDPALLATSLLERARLFNAEGNADSALEACDKALAAEEKATPELRAALPQPLSRALLLVEKGYALHRAGKPADAGAAFGEAMKVADEAKDANARGHASLALSKLAMSQKDLARANDFASDAVRCFRAVGDRIAEGRAIHDVALVELARGNAPRAAGAVAMAERIFTEIGHREGLALVAQARQLLQANPAAAQARS